MTFFEGAVSYHEIKTMPLSELFKLQEEANVISRERVQK
jgi:hypothetical protein